MKPHQITCGGRFLIVHSKTPWMGVKRPKGPFPDGIGVLGVESRVGIHSKMIKSDKREANMGGNYV